MHVKLAYAAGTSTSPSWTASVTSSASSLSMVQPRPRQVPRTSRTVPFSSLALERPLIARAMLKTSSIEMLPSWEMFFTFLRSRGGSLSALMIRGGRWNNLNCDLAVLHDQLAGHVHALPLLGGL